MAVKRRTRRDIGIFFGVLAVIAGVWLVNSQMQRGNLREQMEAWRTRLEQEKAEDGVKLLSWRLMRSTKGTLSKGGTFVEDLKAIDGTVVNLMGFMVPQEQFRDVTEFMLLPLPIECYFCAMPPARDVLFVKLKEGESEGIYREPVLLNGVLALNEGPGVKYFYSLQEASLGPADVEAGLSLSEQKLQHMLPQHEPDPSMLLDPVYDDDAEPLPETSD